MPIFALQLKANLVNVTDLKPGDYNDHRWYLKLKCSGCGEITNTWQYANIGETLELTKGKGICHILAKCSFCDRLNSLGIEILTKTYAPYSAKSNEQFQTIVKFECRGVEPVDFDPRVGWCCVGQESGTLFEDIDLNQKEWADYDEKTKLPTEINEITCQFIACKK